MPKKFSLFIFILLMGITFTFTGCAKKTIDESLILGDWEAIIGDYQEINFSKDADSNSFSAYLDGRLFCDGTWTTKGADIIIELSSGDKEVFKNVEVKDEVLSIDNGKQQYKHLKSISQGIDDLLKQISSIEGVNFSQPEDIEFTWYYGDSGEKMISGKVLKAEIVLSDNDYLDINDASTKVVDFLIKNGFKFSETNISEEYSAYENQSVKVIIKQDIPLDYDPDTDEPVDIKGEAAILEVMIGLDI
jgi:hypothetical protein